jgi:DNA-binding response OmpR family regulator
MTHGAVYALPILLVGPEATTLAPRLELTGYTSLIAQDLTVETFRSDVADLVPPAAVILSPGCVDLIPDFRRCWGPFVVLLLGLEQDGMLDRARCLASGADDFWLTNSGASELLTRLRLHLEMGRRKSLAPPGLAADPRLAPINGTKDEAKEVDLRLADLRLVTTSAMVWRGSRLIALTTREYQLLLLFMRHPGEVISRDTILQRVWGNSESGGSNVIDVYVRYLRQKLEAGGERRLLQTVRGQGYALMERLGATQPEQP